MQRENWEFETHRSANTCARAAWSGRWSVIGTAGQPAEPWRCCTNRHWPARCPPTGFLPADAIRRWSAEGGHPIQDLTAENDLTPLPRWAPGGSPLSAQEIRHCMSGARSRKFLKELATDESFGAPPRKRASCGPAGETGLNTRQPSGLADETRAPPGPPSAHGARPRRRSHIREPAPESRPHRHGWRQWPEPVALACDGARHRATRRSPPTARGAPDGQRVDEDHA